MKLVQRFLSLEKDDQIIFFLLLTTMVNSFVAIVKLILGFLLLSLWFFINAVFNIILVLSRICSIKDYRKIRLETDNQIKSKIESRNYIHNGILLILLAISYFIVSVYMYYKNPNLNIHEYLTYLVALIAFYSIASSIYGMIKYKKSNHMILSAVKITDFANALTSIVLTQVVLLDAFNNEIDVRVVNGSMGMMISIIIMILGLYMIIGSNKNKVILRK